MFFVFGPSGQMFRGSAEQLVQVAPVTRTRRTAALGAQNTARFALDDAASGAASSPPSSAPAQQALAAYWHTAQSQVATRQPLSEVADVMTKGVVTVGEDMAVAQAWAVLQNKGVSQAPVLNAQGRVIGLLLRAEMAMLALQPQLGALNALNTSNMLSTWSALRTLAQRAVAQVMISPVPTVAPQTQLRRLARVLLDTDLPGLPVTQEEGTLVGFVSRTDILRAVAAHPPLDLWSGQ